MKRKGTTIDTDWLPKTRYVEVYWGDVDTDVIDNETGVVVYSTPTTRLGLERAIAFCRRHALTIQKIDAAETNFVGRAK